MNVKMMIGAAGFSVVALSIPTLILPAMSADSHIDTTVTQEVATTAKVMEPTPVLVSEKVTEHIQLIAPPPIKAGPQQILATPEQLNPNHSYPGHPEVTEPGQPGLSDSTAALITECVVADFVNTSDIVNVVTSHTTACMNELFSVTGNDAAAVFSENNIISVANALKNNAAKYQGDNSNNDSQLISFLRAGLYVAFYQADTIGKYSPAVKQTISSALDKLFANENSFNKTDENGVIFREAITLIDSAELNAHFIWVVKRLLNDYDATTQASWYMNAATNNVFTVLWRGHQNADFVSLVTTDLTVIDAVYNFYNANTHLLDTDAEYLLANAVSELGRFLQHPTIKQYAAIRIRQILNTHSIDGEGAALWLNAAKMADAYDGNNCEYYDICGYKEALEAKVLGYNQACSASLKIRAQDLYVPQGDWVCNTLGAQESYFHDILETHNQPIAGDLNDALELVIFDSAKDYKTYGGSFFGMNTNNGGMYLEGNPDVVGNQARFVAYEAEWKQPDFHVWNLQHEYVHYLDGRFNLSGNFSRSMSQHTTWWTEGLAEYISYRDGYAAAIEIGRSKAFPLSEIFKNDYNSGQDRVYRWGYLAVRYMFENHKNDVRTLLAFLRSDQYEEYQGYIDSIGNNYDDEWYQWLETVQVGTNGIIASGPNDKTSANTNTSTNSNSTNTSAGRTSWYALSSEPVTATLTAGDFNSLYFIDVVENSDNLTITTRNGNGDLDLYVRYEDYVNQDDYDYRSNMQTNNEQIIIKQPRLGRYYVGLYANQNSSDVELSASINAQHNTVPVVLTKEQDPTDVHLVNGIAKVNVSSEQPYYAIYVPNGTQRLIATLSGGSGDAAIYANPNGWASESDYYWTARNSSGNQEQIDVTHPSTENYIYFYLNGEFQDAEFKVQLIQN